VAHASAAADARLLAAAILASTQPAGRERTAAAAVHDRELVLSSVRRAGESLKYADEALRSDREVVLAAVSQTGVALRHATEDLRRDSSVVAVAVERSGGAALQFATQDLRDRAYIREVLDEYFPLMSHWAKQEEMVFHHVASSLPKSYIKIRPKLVELMRQLADDLEAEDVWMNALVLLDCACAVPGAAHPASSLPSLAIAAVLLAVKVSCRCVQYSDIGPVLSAHEGKPTLSPAAAKTLWSAEAHLLIVMAGRAYLPSMASWLSIIFARLQLCMDTKYEAKLRESWKSSLEAAKTLLTSTPASKETAPRILAIGVCMSSLVGNGILPQELMKEETGDAAECGNNFEEAGAAMEQLHVAHLQWAADCNVHTLRSAAACLHAVSRAHFVRGR